MDDWVDGWMEVWGGGVYLTCRRGPLKVVSGFLAPLVRLSPLSLSSNFRLSSWKLTWNNISLVKLSSWTHKTICFKDLVKGPFGGIGLKTCQLMCKSFHCDTEGNHWPLRSLVGPWEHLTTIPQNKLKYSEPQQPFCEGHKVPMVTTSHTTPQWNCISTGQHSHFNNIHTLYPTFSSHPL